MAMKQPHAMAEPLKMDGSAIAMCPLHLLHMVKIRPFLQLFRWWTPWLRHIADYPSGTSGKHQSFLWHSLESPFCRKCHFIWPHTGSPPSPRVPALSRQRLKESDIKLPRACAVLGSAVRCPISVKGLPVLRVAEQLASHNPSEPRMCARAGVASLPPLTAKGTPRHGCSPQMKRLYEITITIRAGMLLRRCAGTPRFRLMRP